MARGSGGKDRTKPVVNITSPTNLSTLVPGSTQTITVSATDNRSVSYVNVRIVRTYSNGSVDQTSFNINDTSAPYSYTWSVPNINNATYRITATAYDGSGNSAVHEISVNVSDGITTTTTTIAPPPPPPTLPSSWILAAPTAFDQGGEGSCTSMAMALVLSVTHYYHTGATSYSQSTNIFSPEYLYDKIRQKQINENTVQNCPGGMWDCGAGSGFVQNIVVAKDHGCARWSVLPYSSQFQGCQADPNLVTPICSNGTVNVTGPNPCNPCVITSGVDADAANYKIKGFGSLFDYRDLYTYKRLIRNGHAIGTAKALDSNLAYPPAGDCTYIWTTPGYDMAAHAFAIIGYDDSKQAFLMQNSWGTNWGCNGRIWVSYNSFFQYWSSGWWVTYRDDLNPYPFL